MLEEQLLLNKLIPQLLKQRKPINFSANTATATLLSTTAVLYDSLSAISFTVVSDVTNTAREEDGSLPVEAGNEAKVTRLLASSFPYETPGSMPGRKSLYIRNYRKW